MVETRIPLRFSCGECQDEERHIKNEKLLSYDQGKAEGETKKLIRQVQIKFRKNLSCEEIAEALEEDSGTIQDLCDIIGNDPDADEEAIYELFVEHS